MTPESAGAPPAERVSVEDFAKLDIRVGRILEALAFPEARRPAYRLRIDFGPGIGERRSSAQLTGRYALEDLPGRQVLAVVNLPPRRIGPFVSEVLTLGVSGPDGHIVLVQPDGEVETGAQLH